MSFKINTNWCAVTGAPSSGKTSVINELAKRGHAFQKEAARDVIETMMAGGLTLDDIRGTPEHTRELQQRILDEKMKSEGRLDTRLPVFMDRGVPDSITYFRIAKLDPSAAVSASEEHRYKRVFIFDLLPMAHDKIRTEDDEAAALIDKMLEEDYRKIGYDPIRVPVMSVRERASFIEAKAAD